MKNIFDEMHEVLKRGEHCALCTIVATKGSTPLKAGAKMVVTSSGKIFGTIGGGDLEKTVIENALNVINIGQSEMYSHNLLQQHGMCCGGSVSIFIDFISAPDRLYIFGSGHVGRALGEVMNRLSFEVYVIDDRKEELDKMRSSEIHKLPFHHSEILPRLPFGKNVYVAVMTRDHTMDREILASCIQRKYGYLGMIGSMRKVEVTRKMFISGCICTAEEFAAVDTPMGFNINAQSPEEIAISIAAKIIQVKNTAFSVSNIEAAQKINKITK
ncbi:MAG: XdhC family protein [Bacteroidia bacterium]|nr:XdhC family protein [Bacteroidia bacterium]